MQVSGNRPIAARPMKATAAPSAPAANKPATAPTPPRAPKIEAKAQGVGASIGLWSGVIGGGLIGGVGTAITIGCINALAGSAALPFLVPVAVATVGLAAIGGTIGYLTGTVEDKVREKVAKNPTSQWGIWIAGGGLIQAGGALLKGGAGMNGAFTGIGSALGGVWQTAVEVKGLKEGGPLTDNKIRLGGAAAATVGGLAAAASLAPAVAAAVPMILPVGIGLAALGWGANLVGQFMDEKRNETSRK